MKPHTIGIDFGTYKTLVSHINPQTHTPETIRLGVGRDFIPTTAYVDAEGVIFFGDEADDMLEDCTGRYLRGFKMQLGSTTPLHMYLANGQPQMLTAKELVKMGLHISFTGVITFKNARRAIEALKAVPMDRLFIETDCPYMAPEPFRGKRNDSSLVYRIAEKIAEVKGISLEDVISITTNNALKFFNI